MVDRDVEEPLDLLRVQVDGEHAVGSGGGEHVRDEFRGDGHAGLVLAVLTGVAEVGQHGGDAGGARAAGGVDHDQQLHQIVVGPVAGRLDQKGVGAADILLKLREDLAVGKVRDVDFAKVDAKVVGNLLRKLRMRGSGIDANVFRLFHFGRVPLVASENTPREEPRNESETPDAPTLDADVPRPTEYLTVRRPCAVFDPQTRADRGSPNTVYKTDIALI